MNCIIFTIFLLAMILTIISFTFTLCPLLQLLQCFKSFGQTGFASGNIRIVLKSSGKWQWSGKIRTFLKPSGNLEKSCHFKFPYFFNIPLSYTAGKHRCDSRGGAGWGSDGQRRYYCGLPLVPSLAARSRVSTWHNLCTRFPVAHASSQSSACAHSALLLFHFVTWFCSQPPDHWFAKVPRTQVVWLRSRNPLVIRRTCALVRWEAVVARRGETAS